MKILFDHQTFTLQDYGGISRYFFELYSRFNQNDNCSEISLRLSNNAYLNSKNAKGLRSFFPGKNFKGKYKIQETINRVRSVNKIKEGDFDVFHPTYYDPYFLKYLNGKPFVVTFLDMIHEKFRDKYSDLQQDSEIFDNKKILLEKANKVIAISESTKRDIMDIFNVPGDKIEVVYLGSSLQGAGIDSLEPLEGGDYLLFVGNRGLYKNFSFYLSAIAEIMKQENLKMVCAGGGNFDQSEKRLIEELGLTSLVKFYPINDTILTNLYTNALAFVFPSLYEGFGIPVLEAFSCGTPCLLSRGGSLEEVGGDAALYFDAESKTEISEVLSRFLSDGSIKIRIKENGFNRLKKFSWQKAFDETMAIYKSVL